MREGDQSSYTFRIQDIANSNEIVSHFYMDWSRHLELSLNNLRSRRGVQTQFGRKVNTFKPVKGSVSLKRERGGQSSNLSSYPEYISRSCILKHILQNNCKLRWVLAWLTPLRCLSQYWVSKNKLNQTQLKEIEFIPS